MSLRTCRFALLALALGTLGACNGYLKENIGLAVTQPSYGALHPYYASLCAASQFRKLPDTGIAIEGGGFGGHAVLYLNGVCRVTDAHYPVLKLCEEGFDADDAGVGLSVNDHYENANWVATPGRQFFFHGLIVPGKGLTRATYDATVATAEARGILDGVTFRDVYLQARPPDLDEETYKYQISFGTDYALNGARDRYCAKVPLSRAQMGAAVDYLNGVNAPYRAGTAKFTWSVVRNNCSHLYHNALAAAGVWPVWPVNRPLVVSAFSFPTPKNEFVNLVRRTNDGPLDDVEALWADPVARSSLLKFGALPVAPGATIELERIAEPNAIYDGRIELVFYDDPTLGHYERRYRRILRDPRYSDTRANLAHYAALYAKIEADRRPLAWHLRHMKREGVRDLSGFEEFYARYYAYIGQQRSAVTRDLKQLGAGQEWALRARGGFGSEIALNQIGKTAFGRKTAYTFPESGPGSRGVWSH